MGVTTLCDGLVDQTDSSAVQAAADSRAL